MSDFPGGILEKLTILAFDTPDYMSFPIPFIAYFNPQEYTRVFEVEYNEPRPAGASGGPAVFNRIKPQEYDLTLVFDGTGTAGMKIDVYAMIQLFMATVGYSGSIHRPRYLMLVWGTFISRCVVKKISITYKLFKPCGIPLRANVTVSFSEHIDSETSALEANNSSPDLTHVRVIKDGDTLPNLSNEIYGDPKYYIELAKVNNIKDFRNLKPGEKIYFPPLEK
ncbi:MAG: hypothetical protein WC223_05425 [Bacteroidales bacterium]|jgi:LysM repeat protein